MIIQDKYLQSTLFETLKPPENRSVKSTALNIKKIERICEKWKK